MTEQANGAPTGEPTLATPARRLELKDFFTLVCYNSKSAFLIAFVLGALIIVGARWGRVPFIQYEAETEIVSLTVAGQLETVWNLPGKRVAIPTVVGDSPGPPREEEVGAGALVLPEGTRLTLIRLPGEPLRLRIDGHSPGVEPTVDSATFPAGLALPEGSVLTLAGREEDSALCRHQLPPFALRGVGAIEIGSSLANDSRVSPDELARLTEAEFLARNAQPLLASGRVFVRGRPLLPVFSRTYDADELALQAGDQLRVPTGAAGTGGIFILQVTGCEPLAVRGFVQSRDVEILRLGSDSSPARVSFWQAVTRDPMLTFLIGLFGTFLATYWSFVNQRAGKVSG